MKKYFVLFVLVLSIISCETDDICIDETTPHLIIRFYDKTDTSKFKKVTNLKVEVVDAYDNIIKISKSSTDSIVIPLNIDLDLTKIQLTKNFSDTSDGIEDSFTLSYNREDIFVSNSCGFKTVYNDINKQDISINWIQNINILFANVDNENQAHINILH